MNEHTFQMAELGGSFERGSGERQGGSGEPEKKRRKIQDSMGQKSRLDLEEQLSRKRTLATVAQCPGMLDLGGGERKELTFDAIAEEYKKSDGGKTILAGETLVLPVVDYVKNSPSLVFVVHSLWIVRSPMLLNFWDIEPNNKSTTIYCSSR